MPTIKQLRFFDAVVKHKHFGRAADACSVSQPALSAQISQLEGELGLILIERGSRGLKLTEGVLKLRAAQKRSLAPCETWLTVRGILRSH